MNGYGNAQHEEFDMRIKDSVNKMLLISYVLFHLQHLQHFQHVVFVMCACAARMRFKATIKRLSAKCMILQVSCIMFRILIVYVLCARAVQH